MNMSIRLKPLVGQIDSPPSKSDAHRVLILAALADKQTEIGSFLSSEDVDATINCLRALGAHIEWGGDSLIVSPAKFQCGASLDCAESGSTLRFLLPIAAAHAQDTLITGRGRLPDRPIRALLDCMKENGGRFSSDRLPLTVYGGLQSGVFRLPGDTSSQYVSGLLMALPMLSDDSVIELSSPLQSSGYVEMTRDAMARFSVRCEKIQNGYHVFGNQIYRTDERIIVEGDWSGAAFFIVAGAICGKVSIRGLSAGSLQKDRQILDIVQSFGAHVTQSGDMITVSSGTLFGIALDVSEIPDLVPVLAVLGAFAGGQTILYNARRLRLKESDRLESTAAMIEALGGKVEISEEALIIHGTGGLSGGVVDSFADHRIAMAASIAAAFCQKEVTVLHAECCAKSYPHFYTDFKRLGGVANELNHWR